MTDVSDQATELEEAMRDQAQARQRAAQEAQRVRLAAMPQVSDCAGCGLPIPIKRKNAAPSCTRCLLCEQTAEALRKRGQR